MKTKWIVEYWDDSKDCLKRVGFHTYEEAVTHQHKVKKRFNRVARIEIRGS